jgi:hypothetical protein
MPDIRGHAGSMLPLTLPADPNGELGAMNAALIAQVEEEKVRRAAAMQARHAAQAPILARSVQALQQSSMPAFAGNLIDDPLIQEAGQGLSKSRQAINTPMNAGAAGLYLPGEGQFVENPAWSQEQESDRGTQEMTNIASIMASNQRAAETNQTRTALATTAAMLKAGEDRQRHEESVLNRQERERAARESAAIQREGHIIQKQIAENNATAPITVPHSELSDAKEQASRLGAIQNSANTWKDTYANSLGSWTNEQLDKVAIGELPILSAAIPQNQIDAAKWFAEFKRYHEAKERHDLLGATLTNNEQADWRKLTIPRGMPSDQVRSRLEWIKYLDSKAMKRQADIMFINYRNPKMAELFYKGWFPGMPDPTPPAKDPPGLKMTREGVTPAAAPAGAAPAKAKPGWIEIK